MILIIILGVLMILTGILLLRYYYKNSYEDDPKPVKTENILLYVILLSIVFILLGIIG